MADTCLLIEDAQAWKKQQISLIRFLLRSYTLSENKLATDRIGTEPIGRLLLRFSIPAIIGMFVNAIYNIVDRIYLGQGVDPLAIAGVGMVMPIMMIIQAFSMLVGIGANSLFSIRLGEGRSDEVEKIMGHAFALLFLLPAVCITISLIFTEPILRNIMKVSGPIFPYAYSYLRIILYGAIFAAMSPGLTHFIRSDGHPKTSMVVQIVGAVTNIILDPIFIFTFNLGVAGAAWATIISQFVSFVFVMGYFSSKWTRLRFRVKFMKLDARLTIGICAIGFAPFVMQFAMSLVGILQNAVILKYGGDEALTAMTIFFSALIALIMPLMGIGQGAQPIIGYNYGAKQYKRVKKCFKYSFLACTCVLSAGFIVTQLAPGFCFSLFSKDTGHLRELGMLTMRICTCALPFIAMQMMGGQFFQAIGKPVQSTILSLSRQILFFIPSLLFLPLLFDKIGFPPIYGVYWTFPVSDVFATILSGIFVFREFKNWKKQGKLGI
ncbi:MAG: MATE family efflux transporter [Treponema sp.]|jgi:putative MATE family efflux protein|nr:MATE family efflux transporter [Treponema sp.]